MGLTFGLGRVFMFLAVWAALTTTSNARAEIIIGGEDDIGVIGGDDGDSGFEGDLGEDGDDLGGDCNEGPDDKFESPPMTGGGVIDLLGVHDRRPIACFARNGRGDVFEALGVNRHHVQERALRKCEAASRRCRPLGCHRLM